MLQHQANYYGELQRLRLRFLHQLAAVPAVTHQVLRSGEAVSRQKRLHESPM